MTPVLFFFHKIALVIQGLLSFHKILRIVYFLWKMLIGLLIGIALNSYIALGSYRHFNNINSPSPWAKNIFLFICVFIFFFSLMSYSLQYMGLSPPWLIFGCSFFFNPHMRTYFSLLTEREEGRQKKKQKQKHWLVAFSYEPQPGI